MSRADELAAQEDKAHWTGRALYAVLRWVGMGRLHPYQRHLAAYRLASLHALLTCVWPVPLWRIFARYGSDKHQPGQHSYGFTYAEYLSRFRYRRIRLLEIGIGGYGYAFGGRSLLAWRAFFPFAQIIACDLVSKPQLAGTRVRVRQTDQSSAGDLARLALEDGPFHVIIDDGSHLNAHQILTFEKLFDSLKDGGFYFIEDVQTSFWPDEVAGVRWDGHHADDSAFRETCVGYFLELTKYLNYSEFLPGTTVDDAKIKLAKNIRRITFEHNMVVISKGPNIEPSNNVGSIDTLT